MLAQRGFEGKHLTENAGSVEQRVGDPLAEDVAAQSLGELEVDLDVEHASVTPDERLCRGVERLVQPLVGQLVVAFQVRYPGILHHIPRPTDRRHLLAARVATPHNVAVLYPRLALHRPRPPRPCGEVRPQRPPSAPRPRHHHDGRVLPGS